MKRNVTQSGLAGTSPDKRIIDLDEAKELLGAMMVPASDGTKTSKISLDSVKEFVDKKFITDLGNFDNIKDVEDKTAELAINKPLNRVFVFTIANLDNGIIINSVMQNTTYQFKIYAGNITKRILKSTGEKTKFEEMHSVFLPGFSVNGMALYKLTTDSNKEAIKAALTDVYTKNILGEKELDRCLISGNTIKDSLTNGTIQIGWSGQGFIFTEVSPQIPTKNPAISSVVIKISGEEYKVLKNGVTGIIVTEDKITEINETIADLTKRIEALEKPNS